LWKTRLEKIAGNAVRPGEKGAGGKRVG